MKKLRYAFLVCFTLFLPINRIIAQEQSSGEWRWKVALGGALTALSLWMSRYFGKKTSSEGLRSSEDTKESLHFPIDIIEDFIRVRDANKVEFVIAGESQLSEVDEPQLLEMDPFQAMLARKLRFAVGQERKANKSRSYFNDPESTPVNPEFKEVRFHLPFHLIMDETLLFFVKLVKEKQIENSLDPLSKNILRAIIELQDASDKYLGQHLEDVEYYSLLKKKLESIIPQFYSAGLAKDIQEIQTNFFEQNKVYNQVKESLRYLGGYSELIKDLDTLIKQKKVKQQGDLQQKQDDNIRKIEELEQSIKLLKQSNLKNS